MGKMVPAFFSHDRERTSRGAAGALAAGGALATSGGAT